MSDHPRIKEARKVLVSLGLPRAQQNERSALCLLALLNLGPRKKWTQAENPLMGITPIMDWAREIYKKDYVADRSEIEKQVLRLRCAIFAHLCSG